MSVSIASGSILNHAVARSASAPFVRATAVVVTAALTALAAQVAIPLPFTPVPFVLTPLVVLLGGAALGSRLGSVAQVLYILAGVIGLPVFAPSANLAPGALRLIGPTGGYLMAYPIAAFVAGALTERGWDRRYWTSVAAMLLGLGVIFAGGVSWLTAAFTHSWSASLTLGFTWFVALDVAKVFVAAAILPQAWKTLRH